MSPFGIPDPSGPNLQQARPSTRAANPAGGELAARPGEPHLPPSEPGLHQLGLTTARDGLLYVPAGYRAGTTAPLLVLLHGAGGDARGGIGLLLDLADASGTLLLAPDSRGRTWDVILARFGPDVTFLDRALSYVFDRYRVDPERIAIGGFSDGASYALSIGLTNGDLFGHVLAFSPGFAAPGNRDGRPRIYISHGTDDRVLPIARTSRRIAPMLKRQGYDVLYDEFAGAHELPPDKARRAIDRLLQNPVPQGEVGRVAFD